jgi:hypothetical protein
MAYAAAMSTVPQSPVKRSFISNKALSSLPFILFFAGTIILLAVAGYMIMGQGAASSDMQKSLSSHGVSVDAETAERVRRNCANQAVTVDVITNYQGRKQVVTVQCSDDGVSDVAPRYGN